MSENEYQSPTPSKQTSSVPLKKETVRVTLRAADAGPSVPSATVAVAPVVRPPVASGPLTASTPPTATAGPPRAGTPAPTIALRTVGAPAMSPAPTIRLASAAPTGMMKSPGQTSTVALPKATVQLQTPTRPLGTSYSPSAQMASVQNEEENDVDTAGSGLVNGLAGFGFAAALAVLVLQLMTANTWISAADKATKGDWMELFQ